MISLQLLYYDPLFTFPVCWRLYEADPLQEQESLPQQTSNRDALLDKEDA